MDDIDLNDLLKEVEEILASIDYNRWSLTITVESELYRQLKKLTRLPGRTVSLHTTDKGCIVILKRQ